MKPRKSMIAAMVCLVWMAHCAVAQPSEEQQKRYPFVNYAANTLHYDSGATRIRAFFARWHTMATNGNSNPKILIIYLFMTDYLFKVLTPSEIVIPSLLPSTN